MTGTKPFARYPLALGGSLLSLFAYQSARADSVPCLGVNVYDSQSNGIVDSTSMSVNCIQAPGAALSFGGRVAPTLGLGDPRFTTTYTYDTTNQLTGQSTSGITTTYTYDSQFRPTEVTEQSGGSTTTFTYAYDGLGRLSSETETPSPGSTTTFTYGYDGAGELQSVTEQPSGGGPSAVTTYTYDALDRMVSEADPGGRTVTYTYDAANRLTHETDSLGRTTTVVYDAVGNTIDITSQASGPVTTSTYDYSGGDLTSSTDPSGNTTTYSYDAHNRTGGDSDPTGSTPFVDTLSIIPEPSALVLIGSTLAGLLGLNRRARRKA
jgi:YD repeat-containing protein